MCFNINIMYTVNIIIDNINQLTYFQICNKYLDMKDTKISKLLKISIIKNNVFDSLKIINSIGLVTWYIAKYKLSFIFLYDLLDR